MLACGTRWQVLACLIFTSMCVTALLLGRRSGSPLDRALAGTRQFFFDTPLEVCCTASAVTTAALCIFTEITSHARTGSRTSSVFLCRAGHCWLRRRAALAKLWIQLLCTCRQRTVAVWTVWSCRRKSWCPFGATILREVTSG